MSNKNIQIRVLHDILRKNVLEHPDKIAVICDSQRLTYRHIDEASNRLAHALAERGAKKGDRALIYLLNSTELVISIFAALKLGMVYSVVDYANTIETIGYMAEDCGAIGVITSSAQFESVTELIYQVKTLQFAVFTGKVIDSTIENLLFFDTIQQQYAAEFKHAHTIDCDLAYLLYTSGSTGNAKGVLTTHRSALFTIVSGAERFEVTEDDIHALPLPLSFAPGMNQFYQTLFAGGTVLLEKSFTFPAATLKRMADLGATGLGAVPTILAFLMRMDLQKFDLGKLRYIISSGAALAPSIIQEVRKKIPQALIYSMYGMAEASFILCLDPSEIDRIPGSVGKQFPGTEVWIQNENGVRLGAGESGELIVRGGHVRSGYWNDPLASEKRFRPGPLAGELICHTGDIFQMDEDGNYYFIARSDEVIKSGAKKVAPKEIENVLYQLPGVTEAAAIGIPDTLLGQVIKAFVVLKPEHKEVLTADDILQHCVQSLESFKVPRQIEIMDKLPKTSGGKIKKTELS